APCPRGSRAPSATVAASSSSIRRFPSTASTFRCSGIRAASATPPCNGSANSCAPPPQRSPTLPRRRNRRAPHDLRRVVRNGIANVFMFFDAIARGATPPSRTHAHAHLVECMRDLLDEHNREVEKTRVVLDNPSAHSAAALYQTSGPADARRILSRLR